MLLGWIPIIGPIIQGILGIFQNVTDVKLAKIQTEAKVTIESMQASNELIRITQDDIGVRLARDLIMFPVALWTAIISWDTIVAIRHPGWRFLVEKYPPSLEYLPYAVITFLFGYTATRMFRK